PPPAPPAPPVVQAPAPPVPEVPAPPTPAPPVQQALPLPPPPIPPPPLPPRPEPPPPMLAERLPGTVDLLPETPLELPRRFELPLPPAAPPPPPARQAARPVMPPATLPEGFQLGGRAAPPPGRPAARGLDTTVDPRFLEGRLAADPMARVTGANVGVDWRAAFRRWLDQNMRYPLDAAARGEDGRVRVLITANPDGTVRGVRMLMPSSSPSLNSGTTRPFGGARLPAFPPGADPNGVTIELTVDYVLIRGR
ncbi:energy transducer TonB, partial [Roseococcus sp. DSY-14]|uniref:energy transducer TonB n=1 Tax=Roseococcus sp. DSY-14 TaxID=3369650 RepID=UPI00387ADA9A